MEKRHEKKVKNTYIVDNPKTVYKQKDILYECESGKWFLQFQVLQNEWITVIDEIKPFEALKLLE